MRWGLIGAAALALSALPLPAAADGPWSTMLRPRSYMDLIADGDTVWCATLEAGLLRFSRAAATFEQRVREPGGLVSNRLTALALDRSRRLWVGTRGGGASFLSANRNSWSLVNAFDGLQSDTVNVLESNGDTLWIGTTRGIALWNGREIAGAFPDGVNPSPFASNDITGIAEFQGDLWVATRDGIYRSPLGGNFTQWAAVNAGLPTRTIEGLASNAQSLFALDSRRVHQLDPSSGQWSVSGSLGDVFRLADDLRVVTASSSTGIHRWNGTGWDPVAGGPVSGATSDLSFAVAVDSEGRFVAANRTGLFEQPESAGAWRQSFPPGPPDNNILNLDIETPRLYVTTFDEGVGRYDGAQWRYWPRVRSTTDTTFVNPAFSFALLVDKAGRKWVGCWDQAFEAFDDRVSPPQFRHDWVVPFCHNCNPTCVPRVCDDTTSSHTFAWAAALDSSGGHWFGLDSPRADILPPLGLDYYDSAGVFIANYRADNTDGFRGDRIHALTVARDGRVWVGYSGQGIDYFDPPSSPGGPITLRHVSGTDILIVEGLASRGDAVWALTTGAVHRYDLSARFEASYQVPASPSALALRALDVAPDGTAWVGTLAGVLLCKRDGTTQLLDTSNSPLADNDVRAVRIDAAAQAVWIGTAGGLNRYQLNYVAPTPPDLPRLEFKVYPNPVRISALGISLRLSGNGTGYQGRIHDLSGRLVARFTAGTNGRVIWNGRDLDGGLVKPGVYFVSAEAGGREGFVRVAVVR